MKPTFSEAIESVLATVERRAITKVIETAEAKYEVMVDEHLRQFVARATELGVPLDLVRYQLAVLRQQFEQDAARDVAALRRDHLIRVVHIL